MDSTATIRDAIAKVAYLRSRAAADAKLGIAVTAVKRLQAKRFRHAYADLLASKDFCLATRFFLEELYGEEDYSERDSQFARIAGTLATIFPASVVGTAVALAQLHALTEELDHEMATNWLLQGQGSAGLEASGYLAAWHLANRGADRMRQLKAVLVLGSELGDLTRKPGLGLLLRLMRRPARTSGLGSLQQFLERGFDIFAVLARSPGRVAQFLTTIETRELAWLEAMNHAEDIKHLELLRELLAPSS
jgi:hypothetical protein